ncbi:MAG: uncharacterized protein PWP57_420 [Candidatus Atribacteria bacterium]|nr:uncharacterized protein [Candidatus Atribacteria bacterium]
MVIPKFLADCMLGKLARWLRILGYDTKYLRYLDDAKIIALARFEHRILLTKDRDLAKRAPDVAYLIFSSRVEEQVQEVINAFRLTCLTHLTRCPHCNELLFDLPPEEAKKEIPLFVSLTFSQFKKCPKCHRIYWPGTHWQKIIRTFPSS